MSDTNAQEPTMEEILASIRRIISEDDAPAADAAPTQASPVHAVESAPEPTPAAKAAPVPPAPEEDVLELTHPVDQPEPARPEPPRVEPTRVEPIRAEPAKPRYEETLSDLDVFSNSRPPPSAPAFNQEPLVGSYAAEASATHFGALARTVALPREGRTLEDLVREMLKPMLRDWLDHNLPAIVEARVQAEVERISRRQDY